MFKKKRINPPRNSSTSCLAPDRNSVFFQKLGHLASLHGDVRAQRSQGPRHNHPMSSITAGKFGYVIEAVCDAVCHCGSKRMTLGEVNIPVVRLTH